MNERIPPLLPTQRTGGNWLARVAFGIVGVAVAVMAFFFLTIALMIGAAAVLVFGVRWWWLTRRVRAAAAAAGPLEGEYSVVDRHERLR